MELLSKPWAWYISGPLIALIMFALIWFGKRFGMSSNLRTLCSIGGAGRWSDFFKNQWQHNYWNLIVVLGAIIGGFIAIHYLENPHPMDLNPKTIASLESYGFEKVGNTLLPEELFGISALSEIKTWIMLIIGGFLVGFGTRYAGGCTSGHAFSGLSYLLLPSLIAVIGFFIGGLLMTLLILPLIL
jgi:uncharacterized membrane protein YedE/YeeE